MNRGLLRFTTREIAPTVAVLAVALMVIMSALTLVLPQIQGQMTGLLDAMPPFVTSFVSAMLGLEVDAGISPEVLQSFLWVHPTVLAILWTLEIILTTRYPSSQVDRGTIDVILGWPVSRRAVFIAESLGWLVGGMIVLASGTLAHLICATTLEGESMTFVNLARIVVNLFGVYIAVAGLGCVASSLCDRRGRAALAVMGIVVASFLLNFLGQFWEPVSALEVFSVLNYYRPALIIRDDVTPVLDLMVLYGVGIALWFVAGEITARRSLCTV